MRTNSRSQSRVKRSLTGVEDDSKQQSYVFKASKMPDFSDTYHGIKPKSPKKLTTFTEFNLSTHNRGTDKQQKLQEMIDSEQKRVKEEALFKATPVKMNADGTMPQKVKSDKKATKAVGIKLVSDERSVKRELFEQQMREKERIKAEEAAKAEQERILAEEAEVRRIRQECNFKATPIKHYSMKLGHVPDKKLTVPREPRLQTIERAAMRQDMQDL